MTCTELKDLIDLYLDGELPEELARRVERHLFRCASCSHEKQTLEQTLTWLRASASDVEMDETFYDESLMRLKAEFADRLRDGERPDVYQLPLRLDG